MAMKKMHDQKLKQPFVHVENFSVCLKLSSELFHSFVSNNVDMPRMKETAQLYVLIIDRYN